MSPKTSTRLAFGLLLLSIVLAAVAYVLIVLTWSTPVSGDLVTAPNTAIFLVGTLAFSFVGALIASRRSQNLVGWLFLAQGVYGCLQSLLERYVVYTVVSEPGSLPLSREAGALADATWVFNLSLIVLLLILFPSGQASSRWWKVAAYFAVAASFASYLGFLIQPGELAPPMEGAQNPFGIGALYGIEIVGFAGLLSLFALVVASTVGAILRFRRSQGEEREQFKWFVYAASFVPVFIAAHLLAESFAPEVIDTVEALFNVIFILIPAAVGVAILKYRLYDIDLIINRTLVYVPLTAILAGLYVTLTGLSRTVFTELSGAGSDAAIAVSTLAVVALLTPLKNQLQALVDRHFKEQHDPGRDLKRLTGETRSVLQVMDTDNLLRRFLETTTQALDAEGGAIELRNGATPRLITSGNWDGASGLTLPLQHDGEELGNLMIGRNRRGRTYGEADVEGLSESVEVLSHALKLAQERSLAVHA